MNEAVVPISQRDQRWASIKLGSASVTIGGYGCAITALAIWLNKVLSTNIYRPDLINCLLNLQGGYVSQDLLNFGHLQSIFPQVKYVSRVDCPSSPAPMDEIDPFVERGLPVIVYVDASRSQPGLQQHFVVIIGKSETGYMIADPWYGDIAPLCPRYGNTPAQAVCGIVFLEPTGV